MGQMLVRETTYGDTALNHFSTGKSNCTLKRTPYTSYITPTKNSSEDWKAFTSNVHNLHRYFKMAPGCCRLTTLLSWQVKAYCSLAVQDRTIEGRLSIRTTISCELFGIDKDDQKVFGLAKITCFFLHSEYMCPQPIGRTSIKTYWLRLICNWRLTKTADPK